MLIDFFLNSASFSLPVLSQDWAKELDGDEDSKLSPPRLLVSTTRSRTLSVLTSLGGRTVSSTKGSSSDCFDVSSRRKNKMQLPLKESSIYFLVHTKYPFLVSNFDIHVRLRVTLVSVITEPDV